MYTCSSTDLFGERLKLKKESERMQIGLFGQVAAAFFNFILFFEEMCLNILKYAKSSITHETKTNFLWLLLVGIKIYIWIVPLPDSFC